MDHFFAAVYLRRRVQFMAKSQLFKNPIIKYIFSTAGSSRSAAATTTRRRSRPPTRSSSAAARAHVRGGRPVADRASSASPSAASARSRWSRACRWCRSRSTARAHVRGWRRLRFPKVTIQYGEPITFPVDADPGRDEQQQAANQIFDRVRAMYVELEEKGRRGVLRRLREGCRLPRRRRTPRRRLLLVARLELLPELGVVPGDDHRVRVGRGRLELLQRAAPDVLVGGPVGSGSPSSCFQS